MHAKSPKWYTLCLGKIIKTLRHISFCFLHMVRSLSSVVGSRSRNGWHWPIIFGDARPKYPDHYYSEKGEECFEQPAIDLAISTCANMNTDDILEDLANGKQESCTKEIY
jgi:hypothetical protein